MNKKYAFFVAFLITGLIFSNYYIFDKTYLSKDRERVVISRVIDGDTFQTDDGKIIRLVNINSPEKGFYGSDLSKSFLKTLESKSVEVEYLGKDKYFRNLARVYSDSYINLYLVAQGLSSKFLVNKEELKEFAEAESKAINNSLGIWQKSDKFNCLNISIIPKNETVFIQNTCSNINLKDWIIKDESRKTYTFSNLTLEKGGILVIHSGKGINIPKELFWDSSQDIWNNDRDSLYLFDNHGKISAYTFYGY